MIENLRTDRNIDGFDEVVAVAMQPHIAYEVLCAEYDADAEEFTAFQADTDSIKHVYAVKGVKNLRFNF